MKFNLLRLCIIVSTAVAAHFNGASQSLSINTDGSSAHPSALLDVKSTAKGVLVPRMSKAEKTSIASPATGLLIFQNSPDSTGFYYYDGSKWAWLSDANNSDTTAWKITGNGNIKSTNFIGSTNDSALRFRIRNMPSGILDSISQNTGLGYRSLANNSSGYGNTALGYLSLDSVTSGYWNTAIGHQVLQNNSTGYDNTAVGNSAMQTLRVGYSNVAIGAGAMLLADSNYYTTAVGRAALISATNTIGNTAIGQGSMVNHLKGDNNTAVGMESLEKDSIGYANVAIGWRSLRNNKQGVENTAVGVGSMEANNKGSYNTAVGRSALFNNAKGLGNTAIGYSSMTQVDSASYNTAVGYQSAYFDSTGYANTALGSYTLTYNKVGIRNTAVGYSAAYYNNRDYITAVGYRALIFNSLSSTSNEAIENTAIGTKTLQSNANGSKNTAVGFYALAKYLDGFYIFGPPGNMNTAVGDSAQANSYGSGNTSMGNATLSNNQYGEYNTAMGDSAMSRGFNSSYNVAVGFKSLTNNNSTYPNTAVGYLSLDSNSTGYANTALGSYALSINKVGVNNTAIGNAAMYLARNNANPSNVYDNTAVGNDVLRFTRYYGQTGVGAGALRNDTAGVYNTALGYLSMYQNLRGFNNTAVGTSSLRNDTSGSYNTALGVNSLFNQNNGFNNVAVGFQSMFNNITGGGNTAIGINAMYNHKKFDVNTAVGAEAMYFDTSGSFNAALGYRALRYTKNGFENTALGVGTIEYTDSSSYNTAVGRGASFAKGGTYNTSMGFYASGYGAGIPTSNYYVNYTTNIGAYAGYKNIADQNTFVGSYAGYGAGADSLRGIENTGIGTYSLAFNTSGKSNTAVGLGPLYFNSTGTGNSAVGTRTLINNTSGNGNSALGDSVLTNNFTGSYNTAIGYFSNTSASNLDNATAIGAKAYVAQSNSMVLGSINGVNGATSNTKVGIGITTPDSSFSVANNFLVGNSGTIQFDNSVPVMNYMFKSGTANADRMLVAHSKAFPTWGLQYQDGNDKFNFLAGGADVLTVDLGLSRVGIGTNTPAFQLELSSNSAAKPGSNLWTVSSDERLKTINGTYNKGLNEVLKLNTIMYHYKQGNELHLPTDEQFYGFSAQEVQKIFPEAVKTGKGGYLTFDFHPILVSYINAFKEQQQQIDKQQKTIEELIIRIEKLEKK